MMTNLEAAQDQFFKGTQLREVFGSRATVKLETLGALLDCADAWNEDMEMPKEAVRFLRQEVTE